MSAARTFLFVSEPFWRGVLNPLRTTPPGGSPECRVFLRRQLDVVVTCKIRPKNDFLLLGKALSMLLVKRASCKKRAALTRFSLIAARARRSHFVARHDMLLILIEFEGLSLTEPILRYSPSLVL